jgi:S-formylglutathione hydrolase FrmB
MKLKLESGIPIPAVARGTGVMSALRKMKVKDSFIWSNPNTSNLYNFAKEAGIRITVRKQPNGTHRVWRVK